MKWVSRIAGGLAAVLLLCVLVLLALGRRSGAGREDAAIEIAAAPAQVWQWIDDPAKLKQWVSWVVEIKTAESKRLSGPSAKYAIVMRDPNEGNALITINAVCMKAEPPVYKDTALSTPGAFDGRQTYRLVPMANGHTRLEVHATFHYSIWFAQLMEPLITPAASKKMDDDLAHLKSLVESEAASAAR
jgi:carbon monoxide dehydrogenase subunit G